MDGDDFSVESKIVDASSCRTFISSGDSFMELDGVIAFGDFILAYRRG